MANGKELQDRAADILQQCLDITGERREQYGGNVFDQTAQISNGIFRTRYSAEDIHRVMFCMKLARYGFQLSLKRDAREEFTIKDSILDANVYAALMESERQLRNESQSEANTTE